VNTATCEHQRRPQCVCTSALCWVQPHRDAQLRVWCNKKTRASSLLPLINHRLVVTLTIEQVFPFGRGSRFHCLDAKKWATVLLTYKRQLVCTCSSQSSSSSLIANDTHKVPSWNIEVEVCQWLVHARFLLSSLLRPNIHRTWQSCLNVVLLCSQYHVVYTDRILCSLNHFSQNVPRTRSQTPSYTLRAKNRIWPFRN